MVKKAKATNEPQIAKLSTKADEEFISFGIPELDEVWKPVVGYEQVYEVSNYGQVRRVQRPMKLQLSKQGHPTVCLSMVSPTTGHKQQKGLKLHRLVAQAFLPNPNNLPVVNHKNGIKDDNRPENLEWCTHQENTHHAFRTGLRKGNRGEKAYQSKLTEEQVLNIRKDSSRKMYIARKYGVSFWTIRDIKNGKSWGHLNG